MTLIPKLLYHAARIYWRITRPVTLGVRVILVKDQAVLLVRHTYQPGHWFLVGGAVKRNENLEEAARRESHEEAGADLGELELLGVYTNYFDYKNDHVVVFTCTDFTLSGESDFEIEKCQFFPLDDLPVDLMRGHKDRILEWLEGEGRSPAAGMW